MSQFKETASYFVKIGLYGFIEYIIRSEAMKYTMAERLKIVYRTEWVAIIKNPKDLKPNDIWIPLKEDDKIIYMVALPDYVPSKKDLKRNYLL